MTDEEINSLEEELKGFTEGDWYLLNGRPQSMNKRPDGTTEVQWDRWDIYAGEEAKGLQDLMNTKGKKRVQITHFHKESPVLFDFNPLAEKHMKFLVRAKIIAKELINTHRELQRIRGEQHGK